MKETIIRQYRKKPVIVEAVQLDNINVPCVVRWIGEDKAKMNLESDEAWKLGKAPPIFSVTICTLEGNMKAMPGDYIIKGVHGEFYPCKPDIFEKTYEAIEPPKEENKMINEVKVRWHDGYLEEFKATEVRFGSDLLWMRLEDGKNRHIPLRSVRWFGMSQESHQAEPPEEGGMSVLIKGVEMPTGNDELRLIIHSNGQVIVSHKTYYEEAEAVPVSPHGRLIDADSLLDDLLFPSKQFEQGMKELIGDAPTIIPAEEDE